MAKKEIRLVTPLSLVVCSTCQKQIISYSLRDLTYPISGGFGGKIVEIDYDTKQVVAETSINANNKFGFHRAKKISAYPDNL